MSDASGRVNRKNAYRHSGSNPRSGPKQGPGLYADLPDNASPASLVHQSSFDNFCPAAQFSLVVEVCFLVFGISAANDMQGSTAAASTRRPGAQVQLTSPACQPK